MKIPNSSDLMKELRNILFCLLMMSPMIWVYLSHYIGAHQAGLIPNGMIQYDQVYYTANAKEIVDQGFDSITYSNPYSHSYSSPKIYFQPWTLALGCLMKLGLSPTSTFSVFVFTSAFFFCRVFILFWSQFFPTINLATRMASLTVFWGGGIIVLFGVAYGYYAIDKLPFNPLRFDPPGDGWWFLNLGRNMIYPTESFYHGLFLLSVVFIMKKKFISAVISALTLSFSHPFTGVEFLFFISIWGFIEVFYIKNKEIPKWFGIAMILLFINHIFYYLIFLNFSPEHKSLQEQWSVSWGMYMKAYNFIPAYCLATFFAVIRFRKIETLKAAMTCSTNRMFVYWGVIIFIIANQEFALTRPIQPLHFARGYIYTAIIMLAAPAIVNFWSWALEKGKHLRKGLVFVVFLVFISDNLYWFYYLSQSKLTYSMALNPKDKDVLDHIDSMPKREWLLISPDLEICHQSSIYTPYRSWYALYFTTPFSSEKVQEQNEFFKKGVFPEKWRGRDLYFIIKKGQSEKEVKDFEDQCRVIENLGAKKDFVSEAWVTYILLN